MTDAELRAVEEVIARLREGVPLHDVAPGLDPSLVELGALLAGELTETGWGTAAAVPAGFDAVWESVAVLGGVGASGAAAAAGGGAAGAGGGGASAGAAGGGTAGATAVGGAAAAGTAGVGGATGILGGIAGVVGGLGATTTALVATAVVAGAIAAGVLLGGDDADPDPGPPDGVVQPADPETTEPLDPDLGDSLWSAPSPDDGPDDARGPGGESATGGDALAPSVPADPAPTELDPPGTAGPSTSAGPTAAPDDGPPASSADPGPSSPPAGPVDPPPDAPVDPGPPAPPGPPSPPGPPVAPGPPGPPGSPEPPAPPDPPDPPDEPGDPGPPAPPVAVGGSASIRSGDVHVFDVLGVDGGDPLVVAGGAELDHDSLSVVAGGPGHGSVQVESGTLVYTPAPFWIGHDSFRFRVCDVTGEASGCAEADLEVTTGRRVEHLEQNLRGQPTFTLSFAPHRDPGTATFPDVTVCAPEEAGQCLVTQEGDDVWRWFGPPGQVPGGYPFVLVVHVDGWATEADGPGPTGVSYELRITLTHVSSGGRAGAADPVLVL